VFPSLPPRRCSRQILQLFVSRRLCRRGRGAIYTPDFEFRGRGIVINQRSGSPSGVLRGQAANRLRWFDPAAKGVKSAGSFRLIVAYAGVRSVAVHYLNGRSEPVVEISEYAPDCKIERSNALYGPLPLGDALLEPAYVKGTTETGAVNGR